MGNENINIAGLKNSVSSVEYQKLLSEKADNILGSNKSISMNDLKKTPLFQKALEDSNFSAKLVQIASLDSNSENISRAELKTILTLMDANLQTVNGEEKFVMDNKTSLGTTGGVNQATDNEIHNLYQHQLDLQTEEAKQAEKQNDMNFIKANFKDDFDFEKLSKQKLDKSLVTANTMKDLLAELDKKGIKYTKTDNGYSYKVGDKTYNVYTKREFSTSKLCAEYRCYTDVLDGQGNKIQTVSKSKNVYGPSAELLTYNNKGQIVSKSTYSNYDSATGTGTLLNRTETTYDTNGDVSRSITKDNSGFADYRVYENGDASTLYTVKDGELFSKSLGVGQYYKY